MKRLLPLLGLLLLSCAKQGRPYSTYDLMPAEEQALLSQLHAQKASLRLFYAEPGETGGLEESPVTAKSAASLLSCLKSQFPVSRYTSYPDVREVYFSDSDSVPKEIQSLSKGSLLRLSYFTCSFCSFYVYLWLPSDAPLTCYDMMLKRESMLSLIRTFFPKHYPAIKDASSQWVCDICAGRK